MPLKELLTTERTCNNCCAPDYLCPECERRTKICSSWDESRAARVVRAEAYIKRLEAAVRVLLDNLPDSAAHDSASLAQCWDDLTEEAQDRVKAARALGLETLENGV